MNAVAFSPDGKTLASSSCDPDLHTETSDHAIVLWDVAHGRVAGRLLGRAPVCGIAFSPDGRTLAAAGDDQTISLWDVARHQRIGLPLVGHTDVLTSVAFSPDGKMLVSGGRDHTMRLWDVAAQRQVGASLIEDRAVNAVAFRPDGRTLISGGPDGLRLWSTAGRNELSVLRGGVLRSGQPEQFYSVAFSPDGSTVAAGTDAKVHLWNAATGRELSAIPKPAPFVNDLAWGGNFLVWAAKDHKVYRWNVLTGVSVKLTGPKANSSIDRVAVSRDGQTVAFVDTDVEQGKPVATIRVWNAQRPSQLEAMRTRTPTGIGALAFNRAGSELASAGYDGAIRLWDLRRAREIGPPLLGHQGKVFSVAFSPDGKTLATGGTDETVRFWSVARHQELGAPLSEHSAAVYSVAFSSDGKILASASLDRTVRIWDVPTRIELFTLAGHTDYAFGVAFSRNSTLASASADGSVRLWNGFGLNDATKRLCSYIDLRTAPRLWHQYEPGVDYQRPC